MLLRSQVTCRNNPSINSKTRSDAAVINCTGENGVLHRPTVDERQTEFTENSMTTYYQYSTHKYLRIAIEM